MKKMKRLTTLAVILVFVCLGHQSFSQVYPGDVNDNGEVNNMDFLVLTTALGQTGPPRSCISTDWFGWNYCPWGGMLIDSELDAAMADSNGDGYVDEEDIEAIHQNTDHTHGSIQPFIFTEGSPDSDPLLKLDFDYTLVEGGLAVEITVRNEGEISDLKGMVFSLKLGDLLDDLSDISHSFDESWINQDGAAYEYFEVDEANQKLDFGISKSAFTPPTETEGIIAKTTIIIVDDAIALKTQNPDIEIENSHIILEDHNTQLAVNSSRELLIMENANDNKVEEEDEEDEEEQAQITLFPNPAFFYVFFNLNGANNVHTVLVRNQHGDVINNLDGNAYGFHLFGQSSGFYHFSFYDYMGAEITTQTIFHF